ncbi:MAG: hypothetical protein KAJ86_04160 [Alphaproteobacteria bacterium]|nr:hypothetical protein [Alphaproteobacteria bacterium]
MIASLMLILLLLGFISVSNAATFLYITGALLIISEFFVTSFGILFLNGLLSLFVAYSMQTSDNTVLDIPIGWSLLFSIAFIEFTFIALIFIIIMRFRKRKLMTGMEGMIGQKAVIIEWKDKKGRVRIQGEVWAAQSEKILNISKGDSVNIEKTDNLILFVN